MEVIGFFTTFTESVWDFCDSLRGEVSSQGLCKCQGDPEQFTFDDRDHSAEQCVEQVKAQTTVRMMPPWLCFLPWQRELITGKYEQGRDAP